MIRTFAVLSLIAVAPWTLNQEKAKGEKDLSPSEVFKLWLGAVAKKDTKTEVKLGSKKNPHKFDGDLATLRLWYEGMAKIIHEEISGDRAVVVYRMEYSFAPDDKTLIGYHMNVLLREE